jgi:D-alanine-D-alanine ligase-like ATP-grasp enzyme
MIPQIKCLTQALESSNLRYQCHDKEQNLISIRLNGKNLTFQKNRTPFNSEVGASICLDKEYSYRILSEHVRMPKTRGYLDPKCASTFPEYTTFFDIDSIQSDIDMHLDLPLVIKKNRGALSKNVFLCHNSEEIAQALTTIYNQGSHLYDYVALAQRFIETKKEYRVVFYNQDPVLAYERYADNQLFNATYWEHHEGRAIWVTDPSMLEQFKAFAAPIFPILPLGFVGLDIIVGVDGNWYLIELNSAPKFTHFIQYNGEAPIIDMYKFILANLIEPTEVDTLALTV